MYAVLGDYWWIFLPNVLLIIFEAAWMTYIQSETAKELEWVILEVKVPPGIEKGPQIFEHILTGIYHSRGGAVDTDYDIYLKGVVDTYFSLELVGIDGRTHFYIRAPRKTFKDVVEAQIYAQYPAAEITEVPDYTDAAPNHYPDKYWDFWGTEMVLEKEDAYPIRTYLQFQEKITNELIDPIAAFIEEYSKHVPGEQTWFQLLIRPVKEDYWKKDAEFLIGKLIGRKVKKKFSMGEEFSAFVADIAQNLPKAVFAAPQYAKKEEEPKQDLKESLMLYLSPDEKEIVEAVGKNIAKLAFETTIRWIYIGRKEVFNKGKGFFSVMSPISQFSSQNLNSFAINGLTKTSAYYVFTDFRKNIRKNLLISDYKKRKVKERGFVLNTEELATLYHFPTIGVEAPQTPWVKARRAESPRELPIG
jgi:hypothetical protein